MLTISGGEWSGRRIRAIDRDGLRPTASRVKAALFSIIESIEWKRRGEPPTFGGWRCLDLFAGVGGLGLEILSRGADHCVFVEKDRKTSQVLTENIKTLECQSRITLVNEDVLKLNWRKDGPFDLVLLDPPYADSHLPELLGELAEGSTLNAGAIVVFEHDPKVKYSDLPKLRLHSARTLGPAGISVFLRDA
jgi:16S rRNA (guanine966-N2)-methyltransferase